MLEKILLKFISLTQTNVAHAQFQFQQRMLNGGGGGGRGIAPGGGRGVSPPIHSTEGIVFESPLGVANFQELADRVINGLILLATPIVTIMVLWGAFLLITSAGNPQKVIQGRQTIVWAAVGFGILLIAKGISFIVEQLLYGGYGGWI